MMRAYNLLLLATVTLSLSGCNLAERLSGVGEPPQLSQVQNPSLMADYKPVTMPMPLPEAQPQNSSSLWQTGSRAFFKDQRAARVGDILTVNVNINHKSSLDAKVEGDRDVHQNIGSLGNVFGHENKLKKIFPANVDKSSLIDYQFRPVIKTKTTTQYDNKLILKIAASIIEVLPNGNLVIQGRQEVRDRGEMAVIDLKGIVRREDISSSNTIDYSKIAEARIARSTVGQISDYNEVPWGAEALNKLSPF
ncbi:flagellar basal body L-ring protein FlgH [Candidatus Odyssella thessalonicensis]|uniref:flagellar basal body L-ring protein FlgH n=1 Tax=Candidatus Odyssella thessalonicensis TaxID=84647 RepID=UPI000225AEFE|nr:flagellar basal body L-ring protein FlgH [Candidatus Odyssella thessalonicensis]